MIFENIFKWYKNIKSDWTRTLIFYIVFYAVVITPAYLVFYKFNLFYTDINSALYMLNTLIESLASVLAIVVTLSLVAAQLASSASTRVLVIFRKSPDLWILITVYIIAIIYGLSVLSIIDPQRISQLQWHLSFIYFISVFAFAALIPYIWDILLLMNPENVIKKLGKEITKDAILDSIEKDSEDFEYSSGPIQPLIDMMNNAQTQYQVGIFRIGLETLEKGILKILGDGLDEMEECEISNYLFIDHLDRVARISIREKNEVSSSELVKSLYRIGKFAIKADQKSIFGNSITLIRYMGQTASKKAMRYPASNCLVYLGQLGKMTVDTKMEYNNYLTYLVLSSLVSIWEEALKADKEYAQFMLSFLPGIMDGLKNEIHKSGDEVLIKIFITFTEKLKNLDGIENFSISLESL